MASAADTSNDKKAESFEEELVVHLQQNYPNIEKQLDGFLNDIRSLGNQSPSIVLVTSGGTIVPLESRTVRYVDNFSIGTRGSASAEAFLRRGYAVIFLHRRGSLQPFSRHIPRECLLEFLEFQSSGNITLRNDKHAVLAPILKEYTKIVKEEKRLLVLEYVSVHDYLSLLMKLSALLNTKVGNKAMLYLAAAVSDFYVPTKEMPEHKIQSSNGPLDLRLQMVPKMLAPLTRRWCPNALIVSFKLETDPNLLIDKAFQSLKKYDHHIVIANLLESRKREVWLVQRSGGIEHIVIDNTNKEIEVEIVDRLFLLHEHHCEKC